jgi:DNA-binding response OmpR family regulator
MPQKLLLIDENSRLLTLVGDYLSNLGYEVHRASESDEAAALLENYQYPVIITGAEWDDFGGPGSSLTQCIEKLAYRPRIIRLEETPSNLPEHPALDEDAALVIEKPLGLLRLQDLVHKITSL